MHAFKIFRSLNLVIRIGLHAQAQCIGFRRYGHRPVINGIKLVPKPVSEVRASGTAVDMFLKA